MPSPLRLPVLLLIVAGASSAAHGQTARDPAPAPTGDSKNDDAEREARRLSAEGTRHFNVGDYAEAIVAYKASYLLVPVPGLLYNLAQAHRKLGRCAEAVSLYNQVLGSDAGNSLRSLTQERLKEILPCPVAPPLPAPPRPSTDLRREILVPPPTAPPPPSRLRRKLPALAVGAGAVALAVASFYFAGQAKDDEDQVSRLFESGGAWNSQYTAADQAGQRHSRLALSSAAGSAALAAVAAWLALRN